MAYGLWLIWLQVKYMVVTIEVIVKVPLHEKLGINVVFHVLFNGVKDDGSQSMRNSLTSTPSFTSGVACQLVSIKHNMTLGHFISNQKTQLQKVYDTKNVNCSTSQTNIGRFSSLHLIFWFMFSLLSTKDIWGFSTTHT